MPRPDQDSRPPDRQARAGSGHLGSTTRRTRICAIDAAVGSIGHARDTERPFVRTQFKRQRDRCICTDRQGRRAVIKSSSRRRLHSSPGYSP